MNSKWIQKQAGTDHLLYDSEQDALHVLNAQAFEIRKLFLEGRDERAIASELAERYPHVSDQELLADVQTCLAELQSKDLLN